MTTGDATRYRHLAVTETLTRHDPPEDTLTTAETAAMNTLAMSNGYLRIEQERLPLQDVQATIRNRLSPDSAPG